MQKAEKFLIATLILGFITDYLLFPAGNWVLVISVGFLANIYLFDFNSIIENVKLSDFNKSTRVTKKLEYKKMLPGIAMVTLLLGMLFNFKTWPDGNRILIIGFVVAIIAVYSLNKAENENKPLVVGATKRVLIFAVFGIIFFILPKYFWLENKYRNYPAYVQARKDFDTDPKNETLKTKMEEAFEATK